MTIRPDHRYFVVAQAAPDQRALFIRRTYETLALVVLIFIALEGLLLHSHLVRFSRGVLNSGYLWLPFVGLFISLSALAQLCSRSNRSTAIQYFGLIIYLCLAPFLVLPLLFSAARFISPEVIPMSGMLAALLLLALTVGAFTTGGNFKVITLVWKTCLLLGAGLFLVSHSFGFTVSFVFAFSLVLFATGAVLATTARIIHQYAPHQHTAAALALLASCAVVLFPPRLAAWVGF